MAEGADITRRSSTLDRRASRRFVLISGEIGLFPVLKTQAKHAGKFGRVVRD
jgi:hypothetical protein